jgi:signal transduction histidine kinase/CheY-like chemotaxis protein
MKALARPTLNAKLLKLVLLVMSLVSAATLCSVAWVSARAERQQLALTETQLRNGISAKANAMVDGQAMALRGLAAENAITDVQNLVERSVRSDKNVIYGVFVSTDDSPWAYASPTTHALNGDPHAVLTQSAELGLPSGSGRASRPTEQEVKRFGQTVLEVSRPVIDQGEVLGVIRYGFSIEPLREAVARVRDQSRQNLEASVLMIGLAVILTTLFGFWLVSRAAGRIVRPLMVLTGAAHEIAAGGKGVRVHVATGDELEVLAQSFNRMQEANEDALRKLSDAMQSALEASRVKSEFLANMSHEIRTPMNGVIGMMRLMLGMPLEGKVRRYAETVDASANALMTIIDDVLDFSKMEAGRYTLQSVPFDPGTVVHEVAELQSGRAYDKGLDLVYRRGQSVPPCVLGDPDRYRQILNNLVSNAIKFSDQGEIFVELTLEREDHEGFTLRTIVKDTGVGISEQDQKNLFQPFTQADASLVRRHGGTGLGLAISKRLTEMMGGEIGVSSAPGKGSSFWFTVRVRRSEARVRSLLPAPPEGRRALVIEGSGPWRRIIEENMLAWGFPCEAVEDGLSALKLLRGASDSRGYDVVIIDAHLRDMDLQSLIRELRMTSGAADIPLIVLSQFGREAIPDEIEREVAAQVSKPLHLTELYDCIVETLSRSLTARTSTRADGARAERGQRHRVLVVEDNDINQFVAAEQLEQAGFSADLAANGAEALEKRKRNDYAVVLMDVQMPVMDGYAATRAIRAWEREGDRRRVPIIAVTAHAMVGERDRVLAAGMDDYLSKPVKPHALDRMLRRYVSDLEPEEEPEPDSQELPELEREERSTKLCLLFIDRVPATLSELDRAVSDQNAKLVREKAHKLKGGCLAVGAARMARTAEQLQHEAEEGDLNHAAGRVTSLRASYDRVATLMRREIEARGEVESARPLGGEAVNPHA